MVVRFAPAAGGLARLPGRQQRVGTLVIELLFALPVLLAVVLAVVEFSLLLVAQQQVVTASREGARVAAQGGSVDEVTQAVQQFLGGGSLMNANIATVLTDDAGQPLPSGSPVTVAVNVPTTQAVPDLLAFFGYSIQGETLAAQTVMRKE